MNIPFILVSLGVLYLVVQPDFLTPELVFAIIAFAIIFLLVTPEFMKQPDFEEEDVALNSNIQLYKQAY